MPDPFADAIALRKADHRKVEQRFEKFESSRTGSKQAIAEQNCIEPKIRATGVDLVDLRDALLARKLELTAQAENKGLPPAQLAVVSARF